MASGRRPGHVLFVTGRLAEPALRSLLAGMQPEFEYSVAVMKITVAALMTTAWIARFLDVPASVDLVMLPGLVEGDLAEVERRVLSATGAARPITVVRGPKDFREIPEFFGRSPALAEYGAHNIEILAEINNAPRLELDAVRAMASYYHDAGADVIDIGCTPGLEYPNLATVVKALRSDGLRVSVDSLDRAEILTAVAAGAELVLSVNDTNIDVVHELAGSGARVVAIPASGNDLDSLDATIAELERHSLPYMIDPIIEPIGFGFTASLMRFVEARRRYPEAAMLMGTGNITELTSADSTGVNALLIAICAELGIRSVLTTEVIPWARGSVREIDIARRLMHFAISGNRLPKYVDDRLLTVKDPRVLEFSESDLRALQQTITDQNFRIFADRERITVLNRDRFVTGTDIQQIFEELDVEDPGHAFYLGKELAKAKLAIALGKSYRQEGQLSWGYLTPPEDPRREHIPTSRRKTLTSG